MAENKAVQLVKPDLANPAAGLDVASVQRPTPGAGEVLVQVSWPPSLTQSQPRASARRAPI
jgi:hypothetical protein